MDRLEGCKDERMMGGKDGWMDRQEGQMDERMRDGWMGSAPYKDETLERLFPVIHAGR